MIRGLSLIVILMLFATTAVVHSEENVASYSGNGAKNTRPFSVDGDWEIRWDANGEIFQLYLYSSDGELVGVAANQSGSGKGSCYQPNPGRYYLQVNALGNWTIEIVSLSASPNAKGAKEINSSKNKVVATFTGNGAKNTRPFQVSSGWDIRWNAQGDIFQLYLYSASGNLIGVSANQSGPGTGSSYQAKGGKYYLQVNALGDWTIEIVDED